jgi:maltose O-acetyltransferase
MAAALLRAVRLRLRGFDVHAWNVGPRCFLTGQITVGQGTYFNRGCFLDGYAPINVGHHCAFGPEVMVLTSTHHLGECDHRAGELTTAPVTIGDGCWIGARAVILPGAVIGPGCVIAAGAVVTGECDPDTLYAGVPARPVKSLAA